MLAQSQAVWIPFPIPRSTFFSKTQLVWMLNARKMFSNYKKNLCAVQFLVRAFFGSIRVLWVDFCSLFCSDLFFFFTFRFYVVVWFVTIIYRELDNVVLIKNQFFLGFILVGLFFSPLPSDIYKLNGDKLRFFVVGALSCHQTFNYAACKECNNNKCAALRKIFSN